MKEVDVVYFTEHVARELDIACAVKYLCETQWGMSVHVASLQTHVDDVVSSYVPYVVVLPYARFFESAIFLQTITRHWKGVPYIDMALEQFLSPWNYEFKAPRDEFIRKEIYHHAWGEFYKSYLLSHGVDEAKILVNGNPAYGLYQLPYRSYFPDRRELAQQFDLSAERPWVFFPENYWWAFMSDGFLASYIQRGFDAARAHTFCAFNRESLETVIGWWGQIAESLECEIIVRPRPAVPQHLYRQAFQNVLGELPDRIHIIKAGTVREWVLASDMVASSLSTTLLEAAIAGKPAYILEPYPFPEWVRSEWFDLFPAIRTVEQLETVCAKPADGHISEPARTFVVTNSLSHGDPIANLAQLLYTLRQNQRAPASYVNEDQARSGRGKTKLPHLLHGEHAATPEGTESQFDAFEMDDFSQQEVKRRTERWASVLRKGAD
jgi:surface carbohydrate biosynthesis protein